MLQVLAQVKSEHNTISIASVMVYSCDLRFQYRVLSILFNPSNEEVSLLLAQELRTP